MFFCHKPLSYIPIVSNENVCDSFNFVHVCNQQMQKEFDFLINKYPEVFSNTIGKALNLIVDTIDNEVVNILPNYLNPPTSLKV